MNLHKPRPIHILFAILSGLIVAGLWVFANSNHKASITAPVESGLVGYWKFDEGIDGREYGIFEDRFESGDFDAWTGTTTLEGCSLTVVSSPVHHGSYASEAVGTTSSWKSASSYKTLGTTYQSLNLRFYVRFTSLPTDDQAVLAVLSSEATYQAMVGVRDVGGQKAWHLFGWSGDHTYFNTTIETDTWYLVELKSTIGTVGNNDGSATLYINNSQVLTQTGIQNNYGATYLLNRVDVGWQSRWWSWNGGDGIYFDSVVVSDSYIGPERFAYDSSTNQNHGIIYSASSTDGKIGQALSFNGEGDYVSVPHSSSLDITDEITLEGWANLAPTRSTVSTTTEVYTTAMPAQRKTFYANGRYWVFYATETSWVYRTSTDGINWTDPITIQNISIVREYYQFALFFDGTYVHIVVVQSVYAATTLYRRGVPNLDGTITWSAAWQVVYNGGTGGHLYQNIAVDSEGYPFVSFRTTINEVASVYLWKSSMNDGSWTTATDFPKDLGGSANTNIVPLTNGKMYFVWSTQEDHSGRLWDGSTLGDTELISSVGAGGTAWSSAVAEGDDVHFAFNEWTNIVWPDVGYKHIKYAKRTFGVGWGAVETIQLSDTTLGWSGASSFILSRDLATGYIYCFFSGISPLPSNHIYYKRLVDGVWESGTTDWIDETIEGDPYFLSGYYNNYNGRIGLIYTLFPLDGEAPYKVQHKYLSIRTIVGKGNDSYTLQIENSTLRGYINNTEVSTSISTPSEWHHYVMTYDGSYQKLYIDGQLATTTSLSGSINTSTSTLKIGEFFSGELDEVRIYDRALSPSEVLQNYNSSKRVVVDTSLKDRWLDGLVLLQSFDGQDMDWSSSTAEALDRSGYGNNGDVVGAVAAPGKVGQALTFDGVDDYVEVSDSASLDIENTITVEAWAKRDPQNIIFSDGFENGDFSKWSEGTYNNTLSTDISTENPHHGNYSERVTGTTTSGNVWGRTLHNLGNTYPELYLRSYVRMNLLLDNTRAAGPAFGNAGWIAHASVNPNTNKWGIYNEVGGVQYWESGTSTIQADTYYCVELYTKIHDSAGVVKLWIDGVLKVDQSNITTTGRGDIKYVSVGIEHYSTVIEVDVEFDSVVVSDSYIGPDDTILSKTKSAYALEMAGNATTVYGYINNNEVSATVSNPTEWHHYAMTYDGSNQKLYIDAQLATTTSLTESINSNPDDLKIGEFFEGLIDEVRIYNWTLSADEIQEHYQGGRRRMEIESVEIE